MDKTIDKQIDNMVGALTDPIIVMDPGWGVPDWLKEEIRLARLVQLMKGEEGGATDEEALAYISNASLVAPMHSEWAEIYFYLFTKVMTRKGKEVPEDLRKEEVSDYLMGLLRELKQWLYRQRVKARKERRAGERAEAKAEAEARAPKKLQMF